jgi:hypothetical protein
MENIADNRYIVNVASGKISFFSIYRSISAYWSNTGRNLHLNLRCVPLLCTEILENGNGSMKEFNPDDTIDKCYYLPIICFAEISITAL